ncbi:MAG: transporter [Bdellovibrio bacteriovorus]
MPSCRCRLGAAAIVAATSLLSATPAWSAHPLITEDAYTLGQGVAQAELGFEQAHFDQPDAQGHTNDLRLTLSYGVRDDMDLLLGAPYLNTRAFSAAGVERTSGLGDVALELKWRFWEGPLTRLAIKPGLTFPTGDFRQGLGGGGVVPSVFLVSTSERGPWIWNIHVGYVRNDNRVHEREDLAHLSGSVVYRQGTRMQWALDLSADSNLDPDKGTFPAVALVAAIYSPTENLDLDLGFKLGLNGVADDYALLTGVTRRW